MVPHHIRPTAPIAADALLPGDPKRAMELATALFERPLMSNLHRGLWGYHGTMAGGTELTVQSTGIGGPSAVVVLRELSDLGVRRAIRVGTCLTLDQSLRVGDALVVERALAADGASRALGADGWAHPDRALTTALAAAGLHPAPVATSDLFHDPDAEARHAAWRTAGALAVELSAAPLLRLGERLGVATAAVLVVSGDAAGQGLSDEHLEGAALELGKRAAQALAGSADQVSPAASAAPGG